MDKYIYKYMTAKDLENFLYDLNRDRWNMKIVDRSFEHFHYFAPEWITKNFIVALDENKVIGVINFGVYGFTPEDSHEAVSYIEVSTQYRRKGVATGLIKALNDYLNDNFDTLFLSKLTDSGKTAQIDELFNTYIYKEVKVINF